MPGTHNEEKFKLVGCWVERSFFEELQSARGEATMSQFVRDALVEKLKTLGIFIPREKAIPPDRTGKGGPRRKNFSPETANSKIGAVVEDYYAAVGKPDGSTRRRAKKTAVPPHRALIAPPKP